MAWISVIGIFGLLVGFILGLLAFGTAFGVFAVYKARRDHCTIHQETLGEDKARRSMEDEVGMPLVRSQVIWFGFKQGGVYMSLFEPFEVPDGYKRPDGMAAICAFMEGARNYERA